MSKTYCVAKLQEKKVIGYLSEDGICASLSGARMYSNYHFAVDAMDELRDTNKEEGILYSVMTIQ